jgi:hypothetical protein
MLVEMSNEHKGNGDTLASSLAPDP